MSSEDMSQVRRMLAAMLGGVARGLSASARVVEQASWILRPREPAEGWRASEAGRASEAVGEAVGGPGAGVETMGPADAADAAEGMEPDATDVMEPGGAGLAAPEAPPEALITEPAEAASDEPPVREAGPAPEPEAEPVPSGTAPEGPDRTRVAESHIAALADRPVGDVVSEIANLSTDELEDLYAYEVVHKNRKTVLRAIERAVTPSSDSS